MKLKCLSSRIIANKLIKKIVAVIKGKKNKLCKSNTKNMQVEYKKIALSKQSDQIASRRIGVFPLLPPS